jgi:hypothetical protein
MEKAGKAIMKLEVLGAGCYEYTDEDEPVMVYHVAENVEVRDGVDQKVRSLEKIVPAMDVLVSGSEDGMEKDALKEAAWTLQQLEPEEGPEQEALKKAAPTLQVEKAEDPEHEALKKAALTSQVEKAEDHLGASDSFGVVSTLRATR